MRNALFVILTVILLVGISGCVGGESPPTPPTGGAVVQTGKMLDLQVAFKKIQESQTKEQIIKLLGEPLEKQRVKTNLEYWYYESGADVLQIAFDPDTVSAKRLY